MACGSCVSTDRATISDSAAGGTSSGHAVIVAGLPKAAVHAATACQTYANPVCCVAAERCGRSRRRATGPVTAWMKMRGYREAFARYSRAPASVSALRAAAMVSGAAMASTAFGKSGGVSSTRTKTREVARQSWKVMECLVDGVGRGEVRHTRQRLIVGGPIPKRRGEFLHPEGGLGILEGTYGMRGANEAMGAGRHDAGDQPQKPLRKDCLPGSRAELSAEEDHPVTYSA